MSEASHDGFQAMPKRSADEIAVGEHAGIGRRLTRDEDKELLALACSGCKHGGVAMIAGVAPVPAPSERSERPSAALPAVRLSMGGAP